MGARSFLFSFRIATRTLLSERFRTRDLGVWWIALLVVAQAASTSTSAAPKGGLTKLPVLEHYVEAPYPPQAIAEHREGKVGLAIDVDTNGEVQRVEVIESAGAEFDVPAMEAACGFIFTPAEAGALGKFPVRIVYRYGFVLKPPPALITATATATRKAIVERAINFSGTIKEAGVRVAVALASVEVQISTTATTTRTSTMTDENGHFAFRGLPIGNHVITVRAPLFERSTSTKRSAKEKRSKSSLHVSAPNGARTK